MDYYWFVVTSITIKSFVPNFGNARKLHVKLYRVRIPILITKDGTRDDYVTNIKVCK